MSQGCASMPIELLITRKLSSLSPELVADFEEYQRRYPPDPIATEYHAFLIYPGLGSAIYLTADGRLIWDDATFHDEDQPSTWTQSVSIRDALQIIWIGINSRGISRLASILPEKPPDATMCSTCNGTGQVKFDLPSGSHSYLCDCGGLGWLSPRIELMQIVTKRK